MSKSTGDLQRKLTIVLYTNILEEVDNILLDSMRSYPHPKCDALQKLYKELDASIHSKEVIRRLLNGGEWQKYTDWSEKRKAKALTGS